MVAIVSGIGPGLELSSQKLLGQAGASGSSDGGRNGQSVHLNVANGNLVLQNQDEMLITRGHDIAVLRTYNSGGSIEDDDHDGWRTGQVWLRSAGALNTAGSTLQKVERDGSAATYSYDVARGAYVTMEGAGAHDTLVYVASDAQFEWRDGATGATQRFEAAGAYRLLSARDASGNALSYAYAASGLLASVISAQGDAVHYDYEGANLTQVRAVSGGLTTTRTRYAYDASNRLAAVTVDLSPGDNSVADGKTYVTSYTYDGDSRRVASVVQGDGSSLSITYVDTGGGNYKVASLRDGLGHTVSLAYGAGYATVTDPLGLTTRYEFDGAGQLTRIQAPAVSGRSASRQFTYAANGDLLSSVDGEGRTVSYTYDARGNQILQRDDAGNTVARTFDARNQLLTESVYLQPDADGAGTARASTPLTTRHVYDAGGRNLLRFAISAEGGVTEHRYNGFGERTATVTFTAGKFAVASLESQETPSEAELVSWAASQNPARTQRTDFAYDGLGQLSTRTTYASVSSTGAGIVDASHSVEQYVHDHRGRLLEVVSPTGGRTTYAYDGLGRLLTTTDALGRSTVTLHDDAGRKLTTTQSSGRVSTSAFDAVGRLISVSESTAGGVQLGETKYFYDAADRLRMTQDPTGVRTWRLYDEAGRKVADVDGNGTLTEYVYNGADQLVSSIVHGAAVNTAVLVDAAGLPILDVSLNAIRPAASASDRAVWIEYDAAGRQVRSAEQVGTGTRAAVTEQRYDGASRLIAVVRYADTVAADSTAGCAAPGAVPLPAGSTEDRWTRHFYDADGRLLATLDAEGYLTGFEYDAGGRRTARVAYATATIPALRSSGSLAELLPVASSADLRESFLYDGKGQVVAHVDPEGYLTESVYDAAGNVTTSVRYAARVSTAPAEGSTVQDLRPAATPADRATSRVYDALGRLARETDAEGISTDYAYDDGGHLVSTIKAAGSTDARTLLARFDVQGRLVGELSSGGASRLTGHLTQEQVDAVWAQYGSAHTYDAAGRRTSTQDATGARTWFFYDADGALTHRVNALGEVRETRYDARGRAAEQIAYAARIGTTGLLGGLVTPTLTQALAAVANAAADARITFTYTADGRLATHTDAAGLSTQTAYNSFGDAISRQLSGAGVDFTETFSVDRRGLRMATTSDPFGMSARTTSEYDAFGRLTRSVDALGNARQHTYDRLGRLVVVRDPADATRSTSFDAFGRVLSTTDATGHTTTYAYDKALRTVTVTTAEGVVTTTSVNPHGETVSIRDANGHLTSYAYDLDGRLLRTTTPLTTVSSSYDAAGRLLESVDAKGTRVVYTYDAAHRVLTRQLDPSGLNLTTTYAYDAQGRRVSTTDANGVVTLTEYDRQGQVVRQTVDPAGLNLRTAYAYDARGNTLSVTAAGGTETQYLYDAMGRRIEERVDPEGLNLRRSWAYDQNGNVACATDATGHVTRYAYDAAGRLVFTIDALGQVRQQVFDGAGRVIRSVAYVNTIDPSAVGATPTASHVETLLVPAAADQVEHRVHDRDGRLAATVDGTGAVIRYGYDGNGNVVSRIAFATRIDLAAWDGSTLPAPTADPLRDQPQSSVYDALNRVTYSMDGVGAVVAYRYDGNGNVLERAAYATPVSAGTPATESAVQAALLAIAKPGLDATVRNTFDAADRLVSTVDGAGAVTRRAYDRNGNVLQVTAHATAVSVGASASAVITSSADRVTTFAYDKANRQVFSVGPTGAVTERLLDAEGRVSASVAYAASISLPSVLPDDLTNSIRALLQPAGATDRWTRYGFDAASREVLAVDAEGGAVETQYDGPGSATARIAYANRVDTAALAGVSSLATLRELVQPDDAADRTTRYVYDKAGQLLYQVDALGGLSRTLRDGAGRILETRRFDLPVPDGTAFSEAALAAGVPESAADRWERHAYDAAGHRLSTTDALGASDTWSYDALGQRVTFTNKKGAQWTYGYDAAGHLTSETTPQVTLATSQFDPTVQKVVQGALAADVRVTTLQRYDALGNLVERTEAASRPEQRVTRYEYDAAGRQTRVVQQAVGVYDAANDDPTDNSGVSPRADVVREAETRTYYDALGNAVANRDAVGSLSQKAYDRAGRIVYEVDALGHVTGYTHDAFGGVTALTRYGAKTTLSQRTLTQASQAASRSEIESVLQAPGFSHAEDRTLRNSYDRAGRGIETVQPEGLVHDTSSSVPASFRAAARTRNTYNVFGEATAVHRSRDAGGTSWVTSMQNFDRLGRSSSSVDAMGHLTTRAYDSHGNLSEVTEYATALAPGQWSEHGVASTPAAAAEDRKLRYAYDLLNRRTGETRVNAEHSSASDGTAARGDLTTTYAYDAVGNQTSVTDGLGHVTRTYYDVLGHVKASATPFTGSTHALTVFARDAHGNEIARTEYATPIAASPLDPEAPVSTPEDRITLARYDALGRALELQDANGNVSFNSYDAQGRIAKSWRAVTDVDGVTRTQFQVNVYDAVGQLVETRTPASTRLVNGGLKSSYSHVTMSSLLSDGYQTTHTVKMEWSDLVSPTAGTVRAEVDYQVPVYDESGARIGDKQATAVQDLSAAAGAGGATVTWQEPSASLAGSPATILTLRVKQLVGTKWIIRWQGTPSQATGAGATDLTQAEAGLVNVANEYNAFGEVVAKGTEGGRQEYAHYDTAGRVWRTNFGDGVDKVFVYDLLGNVTAEIRSAGSGHGNQDVKAYLHAEAALADSTARRVDVTYNDLGHVQSRTEAYRSETNGSVSYHRQYVSAAITSATPYEDDWGRIFWSGQNQVVLTWNSLSVLGSGDIDVRIDYITPRTYSESGVVLSGGQLRSQEKTLLNGDQYRAGVTFTWKETSTTVSGGGIEAVTRVRVYKKDVNGTKVLLIDQAPGNGAHALHLGPPEDPSIGAILRTRPSGTTAWVTAGGIVDYGQSLRYSLAALAAGKHEYQLVFFPPGEAERIVANGSVTISSDRSTVTHAYGALTGGTRQVRPVVFQETDRWGNVLSITDARTDSWVTRFRYNDRNQIVYQVQPEVATLGAPVHEIFYDALGRQVAVRDANGYVNGKRYDAGGHLTQELQADEGIVNHAYDVFGQKTSTTDAEGHSVSFRHDRVGNLLEVNKGLLYTYASSGNSVIGRGWVELKDTWTYDQAGQKKTATNGNGQVLKYLYDLRGNVIETRQPLGQKTRSSFDASGRKTGEVDANAFVAYWTYDYFGALTGHTDLGGARYTYTYDNARQLTLQTNTRSQQLKSTYNAAGYVTAIHDVANNNLTTYAYDTAGRRVRERMVRSGVTYQDNHLAYDALGRLRDVADAKVHLSISYDKAGNRTYVGSTAGYMGVDGSTVNTSQKRYFAYDSMNRQTLVDGLTAEGAISASQGHVIEYYRNGNRKSDTSVKQRTVTTTKDPVTGLPVSPIIKFNDDSDGTALHSDSYTYMKELAKSTEVYRYDTANRLQSIVRDGVQVNHRRYDAADRLLYSGPGRLPANYLTVARSGLAAGELDGMEPILNRYNANGWLMHQDMRNTDGSLRTETTWDPVERVGGNASFVANGYDAVGNAAGYVVRDSKSGALYEYTTTFSRFDGHQANVISGHSTVVGPGSTTHGYDANGHLVSVTDSTLAANNRTLVNDVNGKALAVSQNGKMLRQLIVNGEVLGTYGAGVNEDKPKDASGNPNFANISDFNFYYAPVSRTYPNASPGAYTVRPGDTLQSVAQSAYGDSSLWFRIAEANGLAGSTDMKVGQTLNIPNRVSTIHNGESTFKPYDPSRVVGDTTPNLPVPDKDDCGGVGQLLMVVVAVVATIYTAGAMAGALGGVAGTTSAWTAGLAAIGGGSAAGVTIGATAAMSAGAISVASAAVGAAVGSIASQGVGIAVGAIDTFNWKQVGLSAVGGGVSSGLGGWAPLGESNAFGNAVIRATTGNVLTQGLAVVAGLQKSFSWVGVASAAVGAGVGHAVGQAVGTAVDKLEWTPFARELSRGAAAAFSGGLAAALTRGGKVVVQQIAVDAFGNALGYSFADNSNIATSQATVRFPDVDNTFESAQAPGELPDLKSTEALNQQIAAGYESLFVDPTASVVVSATETIGLGFRGRTAIIGAPTTTQEMLEHALKEASALKAKYAAAETAQASTHRALRNMQELADAYRAAGLSGATGDPPDFAYGTSRGSVHANDSELLGNFPNIFAELPQPAGPDTIKAIEPSLWEQTWGSPHVQHVVGNSIAGKFVGQIANFVGKGVSAFRTDGYNPATLSHVHGANKQRALQDTVIGVATFPFTLGRTAPVRSPMTKVGQVEAEIGVLRRIGARNGVADDLPRSMTRVEWKAVHRAERITHNPQSWSSVRRNVWTEVGEAELKAPSGKFSETNIARMLEGFAPRTRVEVQLSSGRIVERDVPLELHHRTLPQRSRSHTANESWNLEKVYPWSHADMDPYRFTGYDLLRIIRGPNSY